VLQISATATYSLPVRILPHSPCSLLACSDRDGTTLARKQGSRARLKRLITEGRTLLLIRSPGAAITSGLLMSQWATWKAEQSELLRGTKGLPRPSRSNQAAARWVWMRTRRSRARWPTWSEHRTRDGGIGAEDYTCLDLILPPNGHMSSRRR